MYNVNLSLRRITLADHSSQSILMQERRRLHLAARTKEEE